MINKDDLLKKIKILEFENKRLQEEREKAKNYNLEYGQLLIKATNENHNLSKKITQIKEIAENCKYKNILDVIEMTN